MNKMHYLLLFVFLLLSGCESKPVAKLTFIDVEHSDGKYAIGFSSDLDIDRDVYSEAKGDPVVWRKLQCALGDDQDFTVGNRMQFSFIGEFEPLQNTPKGARQGTDYVADGYFYETTSDGSSSRFIRTEAVNRLLHGRASIPCKIVMTIYLSRPYYSETMYIPSEALINSSKAFISRKPMCYVAEKACAHPEGATGSAHEKAEQ